MHYRTSSGNMKMQSRGKVAWRPLSEQYPREFDVWRLLPTRRYNKNYTRLDPLIGEDIYWDFELFLQEVGPKPCASLTLERINNDVGYVRGNLRWATRAEQNRNKRRPDPVWMWRANAEKRGYKMPPVFSR